MAGARGTDRVRTSYNKPVSPSGRQFLMQEWDLEIHCFITFQKTVDVAAVKGAIASSLVKCLRLRSVVETKRDGRQRWRELPEVDVDSHVIIVPEEEEDHGGKKTGGGGEFDEDKENEIYINEYLTALSSSPPMRREAPLWEVHVLPPWRRALVLRFHHGLGDCVSLLALLLASCDPDDELPSFSTDGRNWKERRKRSVAGVWRDVKAAWFTIPLAVKSSMHTSRIKDIMLSPGEVGVKHLPTKQACLALCLDDMMIVKNKLSAKINDVFVGVVYYGIAKYLELRSSNETSKDAAITAGVAVNLRKEGSQDLLTSIRKGNDIKWGNRVGYFLLSIHLKGKTDDPLEYVTKAKKVLDKKKLTFEAQYSFSSSSLVMPVCGPKAAASLRYKYRCNTSVFFSNIAGPSRPVQLAKNLVSRIGVTVSTPSSAVDVHMISYNGMAFLQVLVIKEVIPDPEMLCVSIQKALTEMKTRAMNS